MGRERLVHTIVCMYVLWRRFFLLRAALRGSGLVACALLRADILAIFYRNSRVITRARAANRNSRRKARVYQI